jgi:hypothetical protein
MKDNANPNSLNDVTDVIAAIYDGTNIPQTLKTILQQCNTMLCPHSYFGQHFVEFFLLV